MDDITRLKELIEKKIRTIQRFLQLHVEDQAEAASVVLGRLAAYNQIIQDINQILSEKTPDEYANLHFRPTRRTRQGKCGSPLR